MKEARASALQTASDLGAMAARAMRGEADRYGNTADRLAFYAARAAFRAAPELKRDDR